MMPKPFLSDFKEQNEILMSDCSALATRVRFSWNALAYSSVHEQTGLLANKEKILFETVSSDSLILPEEFFWLVNTF